MPAPARYRGVASFPAVDIMRIKNALLPALSLTALSGALRAHCPLCTLGIAAAAGGAAWFGVHNAVIGLLVGAFAVSTGWWMAKAIKWKLIPFQIPSIVILSFILTVLPSAPMISALQPDASKNYFPVLISIFGDYGTIFNSTHLIDLFLAGSLLGGAIVWAAPSLSKSVSNMREGKLIPFQGIMLTLLMLVAAGAIMQFML